MKLFQKYPVLLNILDSLVYFGTVFGLVFMLRQYFSLKDPMFWAFVIEIGLPLLFLYYHLISADDDDRLDYWYDYFSFGCYTSGIVLICHSLFGLYTGQIGGYRQVAKPLWQIEQKDLALATFIVELVLFLLWITLYVISKRMKWGFPDCLKILKNEEHRGD